MFAAASISAFRPEVDIDGSSMSRSKTSTTMRRTKNFALLLSGLGLALTCSFAARADAVEDKRQENLRRMAQIKTATGLAKPAMPSAAYSMKLALAVKTNIRLDIEIEGNPVAVVRAETEVDGRIKSRDLVQSSGVVEWDTAVLKAIDQTSRFPLEANETLPKVVEFHFRPRE